MKKDYQRPEAVSLNLLCEGIMVSTSGSDVTDNDVIPTSGKSRGEWGNVWSK